MKKRCFAFGCSYTQYGWATVADLIGMHFDEYYNFGQPGACNTFIADRLIESNEVFKFNPNTDYILIGITGFGRFSHFEQSTDQWRTNGDILFRNSGHPDVIKWFVEHMYNFKWAVHRSWIAVKTIKLLLTELGIDHKIYMAIDNTHYITDADLLGLGLTSVKKVQDIYDLMDVKESINECIGNTSGVHFLQDNFTDLHPTQLEYYTYLIKHFSEFDTEQCANMIKFLNMNFDNSSYSNQQLNHSKIFKSTHYTITDPYSIFSL